jgi:hypothetical protein
VPVPAARLAGSATKTYGWLWIGTEGRGLARLDPGAWGQLSSVAWGKLGSVVQGPRGPMDSLAWGPRGTLDFIA